MFPSFFPFHQGAGVRRVQDSLDYVYGDRTAAGTKRLVPPSFIDGVDRGSLEIVAADVSLNNTNPATIGSLNFEEQIDEGVQRQITESFFDFVYAGIDYAQRLNHAVAHTKKSKVSDAQSTDIHFCVLNSLTGSDRVYVPYFRRADSYGFYLWAERMNYAFGLSSPYDPKRRRVTMPRMYGSDTAWVVELKRDIGAVIRREFETGRLEGARDVTMLLMTMAGVVSARHTEHGIVLKHGSISKPVTLNGLIYSPCHHGPSLRDRLAKLKRIPREECESEFSRIVRRRADRQWQRFGRQQTRWTLNLSLARTLRLPIDHEPPEYNTRLGRLWGSVVAVDRQFDTTFRQLGDTCEAISRRLGALGAVVSHCIEDSQPVGAGRSGAENPVAQIRDAGDGAVIGSEVLRSAALNACRVLAQPRVQNCDGRIQADRTHRFHVAVRRLGRIASAYPASITEVIRAMDEHFIQPSAQLPKASWFVDINNGVLRQDIWAWLRYVDSPDPDDGMRKHYRRGQSARDSTAGRQEPKNRDQPDPRMSVRGAAEIKPG